MQTKGVSSTIIYEHFPPLSIIDIQKIIHHKMMFALAGPDDEEVQLRDRDATRADWLCLRYCKHYRGMLGICVVCVYNMSV